MKIHYISCHTVLEYDELKLLTELGHEVYSNGGYRDPKGAYTLPRPGVPEAPFDENFFNLTAVHPKTTLPPELIEPYDAIIIMHSPEVLYSNWERIKHKRVIWRSIGQSTPAVEERLAKYVAEGLQIVRYSVMERNLPKFAGETTTIYFYKDPEEFKDWNGDNLDVVNFSQSLLGRRYYCHYDEITAVGHGFNFKVYGSGNDDLGNLNGGDVPYEMMKQIMRNSRAYIYGGTWPAPYTLSFMEAMMTGIPILAIGEKHAHSDRFEALNFYEIPQIIEHGVSGYISNDMNELRQWANELLKDHNLAKSVSRHARQRAIEYFGKDKIKAQWSAFLG